MTAPPAIALKGLTKSFGRTPVLRGVDLDIQPGERLALIGPNGAGKSTLFDLISGRTAPSAGEIRLHGARIDGLHPHRINRRGLARSFQVTSVFPSLSVFENLRCGVLAARGQGCTFWKFLGGLDETNRRTEALLCRVGLAHRRNTPAMDLAYAEQRALELGLTVAGDARVLLLDEPTAGMSRSETERCVELIRTLSTGRTLLMVEHDMGVVFELADRIAVLADGALLAVDTPARVRADPRVQAAYLGAALADMRG